MLVLYLCGMDFSLALHLVVLQSHANRTMYLFDTNKMLEISRH